MSERHRTGGLNANSARDATWQARAERARLRGGSKQNLRTIGLDGCWCGKPHGHRWPGDTEGAPHPREEQHMSTQPNEDRMTIQANYLNYFDQKVRRMLVTLINDYGVRYRMPDGSHIILYAPGSRRGNTDTAHYATKKISASRPAEETMDFLEQWARAQVMPVLMDNQAELLAARFNDPGKRRRKARDTRVDPGTTAPVPAPEIESSPAEQPPLVSEVAEQVTGTDEVPVTGTAEVTTETPPEGYEPYVAQRGNSTNWWKKTGANEWVCKTCGKVQTGLPFNGAHQAVHTMAPEELKGRSAAGNTAKAHARAGMTRSIRRAIQIIEEATGVTTSADTGKLERKIADLEAKLEKAMADRDTYKARLDLIQEAWKA